MKKTSLLVALLFVATIMVSCCGCKSGKSKNPHTLNSHSWALVEVESEKISEKLDADSFTLTFDEKSGQMFAKGSCNRFFGSYVVTDPTRISFKGMGSTKMMCPNQQMEDKFASALQSVESYTIDGDMLLLQKGHNVTMIFQAIPLVKVSK